MAAFRESIPSIALDTISQERGVGQALTPERTAASCNSSVRKRRNAMISGLFGLAGPDAPFAKIRFQREMQEAVEQRTGHR